MDCLDYFKQLCSVPHGSGNTKQVSDLLFSFCKEHGCDCIQDELGNVIAKKPGSQGRENEAPVILQGHMDMVCVADEGVKKDMATDPIDLKSDGEFLWADGTSLGADDGIGIAMVMAVLADDTVSHPPIEAVFTVDEETGMNGAFALDMDLLKGRRMVNLDHGCEGGITVSCAGGSRQSVCIPAMWETLNSDYECFHLCISGLKGGHSGCDITDNRANAGRLMARIFYGLGLKMPLKLCSFESGTADNVIPSNAEAVVAVPKENGADFERLAAKHMILFKHEYPNETGLLIEIEKCDLAEEAVIAKHSKSMMRFISSVPDGMRKLSEDFPDIAQTSSNQGMMSLTKEGMKIEMLLRSSVPEELEELKDMVIKMAEHDGARIHDKGGYPPWVYRKESDLRDTAARVFQKLSHKEPLIEATHGGLEVGIFDSKIDGLDTIAIGPNLMDIHSTKEKVEIASVHRTYEWLVAILGEI